MTAKLRPAPSKARALLAKLEALAERGVDGERISARAKIARLKARFDFGVKQSDAAPDLFSGVFRSSSKARPVYKFQTSEFDVASAVKWAIESAAKVRCIFRDGELLTESTPATARRLSEIARHIACSFRTLLAQFSAIDGIGLAERAAFLMGLYDGMMNDVRQPGQRLPSRFVPPKKRGAKKRAPGSGFALHVHPYTLAIPLGEQIRFAAPVEETAAELNSILQRHLKEGHCANPAESAPTADLHCPPAHQKWFLAVFSGMGF